MMMKCNDFVINFQDNLISSAFYYGQARRFACVKDFYDKFYYRFCDCFVGKY